MSMRKRACCLVAAGFGMIMSVSVAAASGCTVPDGLGGELRIVLDELNTVRASHGLPALRLDDSLTQSAQGHACTMARAGTFTHDGSGGAKARMKRAGCKTRLSGENIAMGFASGSRTMDLWMNSPGHRRIILTRNFTRVGLGVASPAPGTAGGPRWVLDVSAGC